MNDMPARKTSVPNLPSDHGRTHRGARPIPFTVTTDVTYLALGSLGFVLGDPAVARAWHVGPLHLRTGDHVFHATLGAVLVLAGVFRGRRS